MFFGSDNASGVLPQVLAALERANTGFSAGYGNDALTHAVEACFSTLFERKVASFLVPTGTAANALALACQTPPWGVVLCHEQAHINQDECAAPEFFGAGLKLVPLPGVGAKIKPAVLEETIERLPNRFPHSAPLRTLSISQTTECGLVYGAEDVRALSTLCKAHGLQLHMDGARFGNAVAALGLSPADITWRAGVDVISFGATKGGAMGVEAVIFFNEEKADEFGWRRKRSGHLFSKHRFLAAQMLAYLDNDLWLQSARHANTMAAKLAEGFAAHRIRTAWPVAANSLFALLPREAAQRLRSRGATFYEWPARDLPEGMTVGQEEIIGRFITSFATTQAMIDECLMTLKA